MSLFNNKKEFEKLSKEITRSSNSISLSDETRIRSKAKLFSLISKNGQYQKPYSLNSKNNMNIFRLKKSFLALGLVVILGLGSITGIAKANESKPGDALFGLDTLLEEIQLFVTRNPETKLRLKVAMAEERLQELNDLTDELKIAIDSDTNDDNATATSTDSGTSTTTNTTATSTATSTPNNTTDTNSLEEAIAQALAEVDGAVARLKDDSLKLKIRSDEGSVISDEQRDAFFEQVNYIVSREDILTKKLEVKIKNNKLELKLKFKDHDNDDDKDEDEDDSDNDDDKDKNEDDSNDDDTNTLSVKFETDSTTTTNNTSDLISDDSKNDKEKKVEGKIQSLATTEITVKGIVFIINSSTNIDLDDGRGLNDLSVGDKVEIKGRYSADNELIAKKIEN